MGFAGYFLIVADFIRWARENGVPVGPGRGSGAGSLVAYALGITDLDPLRYDLLFERFLNPERVSMPDFDVDFCMEGRDRVIDYVADRYGRGTQDEFSLSWPQALAIGCAQAIALMPGTSRSGITMTAGRALGLSRSGAARFSFLLAIPGIGAAGAYEGLKLVTAPGPVDWQPMVVGVLFAALSGLACIHFLIRFIERIGLLPFTVYRLILAGVIVWHFA